MKPAVLLVPGVLCHAGVWHAVAQALEPVAQVRIARPVQGSLPEMAEAAWAELQDLPVATEVVLAGFSLGGYVVQQMLARPAEGARAVRGALLVSTSPRPESPEAAAVRRKTIAAMQKDFARVVEGLLPYTTHAPAPELLDALRRMMHEVGAEVGIRQNLAILDRLDHRRALAEWRLPVVVMCGAHDRVTPPELSREAAALIPGARLEIVEGAGHMLPAEQPDAVVRAVRALLA